MGEIATQVLDLLPIDVTPLPMRLETGGRVITELIERNTTIPTKKSQFTVHVNNQSVGNIQVPEGDHGPSLIPDPSWNHDRRRRGVPH